MDRLKDIPFGAYLFAGLVAIGLGIGIIGMSSCAARQSIAFYEGKVETNRLKLEQQKMLIEKGLINESNFDKHFGSRSIWEALTGTSDEKDTGKTETPE